MRLTLVLVLIMLLAVPSMNGQPQGIGASGDEGCYCHGGAADETVILVHGLPDRFNVSQTYEFSVEVHHPTIEPASGGAAIGGFRITVDNGALPVPANASLAHVVDDGLTHTRAGAMERNWTFNWTAPDDPEARVAFSFVANAVNGNAVGNGNGNSGDAWNRIELRSVGPAWWDPGYAYTPPPSISVGIVATLSLIALAITYAPFLRSERTSVETRTESTVDQDPATSEHGPDVDDVTFRPVSKGLS